MIATYNVYRRNNDEIPVISLSQLPRIKVERKSDVSNSAHSVKPEAQPIGSAVGG